MAISTPEAPAPHEPQHDTTTENPTWWKRRSIQIGAGAVAALTALGIGIGTARSADSAPEATTSPEPAATSSPNPGEEPVAEPSTEPSAVPSPTDIPDAPAATATSTPEVTNTTQAFNPEERVNATYADVQQTLTIGEMMRVADLIVQQKGPESIVGGDFDTDGNLNEDERTAGLRPEQSPDDSAKEALDGIIFKMKLAAQELSVDQAKIVAESCFANFSTDEQEMKITLFDLVATGKGKLNDTADAYLDLEANGPEYTANVDGTPAPGKITEVTNSEGKSLFVALAPLPDEESGVHWAIVSVANERDQLAHVTDIKKAE